MLPVQAQLQVGSAAAGEVARGSLVLECIESHKPQLNNDNLPQSNLSPNVIISLLESIAESPGNKLQHPRYCKG